MEKRGDKVYTMSKLQIPDDVFDKLADTCHAKLDIYLDNRKFWNGDDSPMISLLYLLDVLTAGDQKLTITYHISGHHLSSPKIVEQVVELEKIKDDILDECQAFENLRKDTEPCGKK